MRFCYPNKETLIKSLMQRERKKEIGEGREKDKEREKMGARENEREGGRQTNKQRTN